MGVEVFIATGNLVGNSIEKLHFGDLGVAELNGRIEIATGPSKLGGGSAMIYVIEGYTSIPGDRAVVEADSVEQAVTKLQGTLKEGMYDFDEVTQNWSVEEAERPLLIISWHD